MKDDIDRWVHLEGPAPAEIRELLDAACPVHVLTPAEDARMEQRLQEALAEDRRLWARRRALRRGLRVGITAAGITAACFVAGFALVLHLAPSPDPALAHGIVQRIQDLWLARVAPPGR